MNDRETLTLWCNMVKEHLAREMQTRSGYVFASLNVTARYHTNVRLRVVTVDTGLERAPGKTFMNTQGLPVVINNQFNVDAARYDHWINQYGDVSAKMVVDKIIQGIDDNITSGIPGLVVV